MDEDARTSMILHYRLHLDWKSKKNLNSEHGTVGTYPGYWSPW